MGMGLVLHVGMGLSVWVGGCWGWVVMCVSVWGWVGCVDEGWLWLWMHDMGVEGLYVWGCLREGNIEIFSNDYSFPFPSVYFSYSFFSHLLPKVHR